MAFQYADIVYITDIYPAREKPIAGVTGELIVNEAIKNGINNVYYVPNKEDIPEIILNNLTPIDIVITIGAGDIWKIGEEIISKYNG